MSEALKNAIKKIALGESEGICTAEVLAVNKSKNTCDVKVLKNNNEVFDVLLQSIEGGFESPIVAYPVVGSLVTIAFLGKSGDAAIVLKTTEVDEIILGGVTFGGLVKADVLKTELDNLRSYASALKTATKALGTILDGIAPGTSAAFETAMIGQTTGDFSSIKNEKVKHG
jgi:hypothetical protein